MIIIDRFEEAFAVCEADEERLLIPRGQLPEDAREGDVIIADASGSYSVDASATRKRHLRMQRRLSRLLTHKDSIT